MTINSWNSEDPVQVAKGGSGRVSTTAYAVICGGTTSTNPNQSVSSTGTLGQGLVSNGAGNLPTFQTISPPLLTSTTVLTSSQVKNLNATPIQCIAPQGSGKIICPVRSFVKMTYGGTNAFTDGGSVILVWGTTTPVAINALANNATIISTSSVYSTVDLITNPDAVSVATLDNVGMSAYNPFATEFAGNAANDNTVSIWILYYVLQL